MHFSPNSVLFSLFLALSAVQSFQIQHYRRNASTAAGSQLPPSVELSPTASSNISLYDKLPGLWFESCNDDEGNPPCTAYCHKTDTVCQTAGSSVVSACNSMWSTYNSNRATVASVVPGWTMAYSTYVKTSSLFTTTISVYTTFSTASVAVVKQNVHTNETNLQVTITPVYALGAPSPSVSVTEYSGWTSTDSWITSPTPSCRYIALSTEKAAGPATSNCGKCSIHGGSVELYYWPPTTSTDTSPSPLVTRSTVLTSGITLFSPTVYISLSTVYASNSCTYVGKNHTGTLLAMNPTDVSTQYHWGGKVAQSGANEYGRMNYADLTGLPPVTDYENQPSCIMFGCSTILPTFNPTLVVPLALRTLAPEWADCDAALEGLYDPPIALTEQAVEAKPTLSSQNTAATFTSNSASTYYQASQCSSPAVSTPAKTDGPGSTTRDQAPVAASDLASLLEGSGNGAGLLSTPTSSLDVNGHTKSQENPQQDTSNPPKTAHPSGISGSSQASASTTSSSEDSTAIGGYIASILSLARLGTTDSITGPPVTSPETAVSANPQSSGALVSNGDTQGLNDARPTSSHTSDTTEDDTTLQPSSSLTIEPHLNGFIVDGMTLAPGSPITLSRQASAMTVKMAVTNGETLIELGTTRTASLGPPATSGTTTMTNDSSRNETSTSATSSSSSSLGVSVTSDSRGSSTTSSSAALGFRRPSAIWSIAAAFVVLLRV